MNERVFNVLIQIKHLYPAFHEQAVKCKYEMSLDNIVAEQKTAAPIRIMIAVLQTLGYCTKQPCMSDLAAYSPQKGWQELLDWCRFDNEIINHPFWTELYYGELNK